MTLSRAVAVTASRLLGVAAAAAAALLVVPAVPAHADDVRNRSWHLEALGLPELHAVSQGAGVTVAVIDTGVDANHPDLVGNVLPGLDFGNESTKGQTDQVGHGTAMASLIAGHGHGAGNRDGVLGIAPKAKILPVNVSVARNQTLNIPPDAIAGGIRWAADNGAHVISVSLHSSSDPDLDRAVEYAYDKGIPVVAATGNDKDLVIGSPAQHQKAVAVSGTDRSGGFGPESIEARETDIAAPSVDLVRAAPGGKYTTVTSVSGATALVSGAFAVVKAKFPAAPRNEIMARVLWTTTDAGDKGRDSKFGWGSLNLRQALTGEPEQRGQETDQSPEPVQIHGLGAGNEGFTLSEWIVAIALPIIVIGGIVGFVLWRRRRRAAAVAPPAAFDPATGGFPPVGQPPPGPGGSFGGGVDSTWARPPGDSQRPAP